MPVPSARLPGYGVWDIEMLYGRASQKYADRVAVQIFRQTGLGAFADKAYLEKGSSLP